VRGRWPGRIAVVALAIAALSACDDGTPVQRGFGSHQILNLTKQIHAYAEANRGNRPSTEAEK